MKPCDLCGDSYKERNRSRTVAIEQAKKLAIEQKKTYALYQEAGEWSYAEIGYAISAGLPVVQIVSGLPGAT